MRPHPDVDLLALQALGESALDPEAVSHVASCGRCSTTMAELGRTVSTVRGPRHDPLAGAAGVAVPAHVWQGIAAELDIDPSVRPASIGPSIVPSTARAAGAGATPAAAGAGTSAPPVGGPHVRPDSGRSSDSGRGTDWAMPPARSARRARRRGVGPLLAVAAGGLVVGAAGTAVVTALQDGGEPAGPQVLAAAELAAFGDGEGTGVAGSARLAGPVDDSAGGDRVLQVWLSDLPDTGDDFLEAWLIDPETGAMVSLGPVSTDERGSVTAELTVPGSIDVGAYALVDVSAEPLDGDPAHSGVSLVRGTLDA